MISDVLFDAANKITQYRHDFPDYDADPRIARWLDVIVHELATLGDVIGAPPPPDNRTHRGECRNCHEITVINLGTLSCEPCQADIRAQLEVLAEARAQRRRDEGATGRQPRRMAQREHDADRRPLPAAGQSRPGSHPRGH